MDPLNSNGHKCQQSKWLVNNPGVDTGCYSIARMRVSVRGRVKGWGSGQQWLQEC